MTLHANQTAIAERVRPSAASLGNAVAVLSILSMALSGAVARPLATALQAVPAGAAPPAKVILVGHDVNVPPSVPRFALVVSGVGQPNAKGEIYSFTVSLDQNPATTGRDGQPVHKQTFALNEIRSWRITIVSGDLLGSEFQVGANDQLDIIVTDDFGPLNGLAEGDFLLVEQVAVRLPPQKLY